MRRCLRWLGGERGSGSVLAVAVASVVLAVCGAFFVAGSAFADKHGAQAAADLAALAAADVAMGAAGGYPCEAAARAAAANGSTLDSCDVDSQTAAVKVTLSRPVWGITVRVGARAGPADQGAD